MAQLARIQARLNFKLDPSVAIFSLSYGAILLTLLSYSAQACSIYFVVQNAEERACVLAAEVDDDNLVRDRECMNTVEVACIMYHIHSKPCFQAIEQKYCEILRDREREVQEELEGRENIIQDMQK